MKNGGAIPGVRNRVRVREIKKILTAKLWFFGYTSICPASLKSRFFAEILNPPGFLFLFKIKLI